MKEFDKIYLSWRKGTGGIRHIVCDIERIGGDIFVFKYDTEAVAIAEKDGFSPYTEFSDINKKYEGNVVDIFAQRLIRSDRTDVQKFYDFWEIEERYFSDKFYLLGHTQGLLPTDNFEFLADYNAIPGIHFLTDIAALSVMQHSPDVITDRDELQIKLETENEHDPHAVAVYKGDLKIGYIKKIHCHVFHKPGGENLKLKIKAIDKNGVIKRIFVKVYSDKQS